MDSRQTPPLPYMQPASSLRRRSAQDGRGSSSGGLPHGSTPLYFWPAPYFVETSSSPPQRWEANIVTTGMPYTSIPQSPPATWTSFQPVNIAQNVTGGTGDIPQNLPVRDGVSSWASHMSSPPPPYQSLPDSDSRETPNTRPRVPAIESPPSVMSSLPIRSRNRHGGSSPPSVSATAGRQRTSQVQGPVDRATTQARPRRTTGLFKTLSSIDLLFVLDTTYSMKPYIRAAKTQIWDIINGIQRAFLGQSTVRVAVVGYKDHRDKPNIEFLDFTTSIMKAMEFLSKLKARGGEGWTADVLGGLRQASTATWKQHTRCLIHIADAPGHSHALHDMPEVQDRKYYWPGSEPHGLTHYSVLQMLADKDINYTFLNINQSTDRMATAFSHVYKAAGADSHVLSTNRYHYTTTNQGPKVGGDTWAGKHDNGNSPQLLFQELAIGVESSKLHRLVLKSVTDSATRTSNHYAVTLGSMALGQGAAGQPARLNRRDMLSVVFEETEQATHNYLETDEPRWDSPEWFDQQWELEGYCPDVVTYHENTLDNMMASDANIKLSFSQITVQARSRSFSQGAHRVASYARIPALANNFVVKRFTSSGKTMEHHIEDARVRALCRAFAFEFNGLVRPKQSIDFVVSACLQSKAVAAADGGRDCMSLEPFVEGGFVKYNSNGLYTKEDSPGDAINRVAQAFSHFTFERSWGCFMVVDLQGAGNLLTDPVIHTLDPNRFKLSELNFPEGEGFKFFFSSHNCNEVCRQLGLVSHRAMAVKGTWQFRERWPAVKPSVCCSNKFCQRIVPLAQTHPSFKFPGYRWCNLCWPQLAPTTVRVTCAATGENNTHDFEVCRFFYESQGMLPPRKCPDHIEKDGANTSAGVVSGIN